MQRVTDLNKLSDKIFDVAIIGGGITGAGILREATKRGFKCILLEKNDFASGTSSKSAKLVHGGLRYLQNGKIGLVKEGLRERNYLLKNFPHLVKPQQFLFPVYSSFSVLKLHIGMWLYKTLSYDKEISIYSFLNKQKTIEKFPAINQENLKGSFLFYDAVTNDARLCNEIVSTAQQNDATAFIYCEFFSVEDKKDFFLIHCIDKIENKSVLFSAKYIINATGHWTDETLKKLNFENQKIVAPSKGIHLVFSKEKFPANEAILFSSYANDGRSMYAVPWENNSVVIGTTDTEKIDSLDEVNAEEIDIQYVLKSIQCFAPSLNISEKDILSSFAGLRPLLRGDSPSKDRARDYKCAWTGERIITIAGGKLTSFHAMAKTALNKFEEKLSPELTATPSLKSAHDKAFALPDMNSSFNEKINLQYGNQAELIFKIISENQANKEFVHDEITAAEIIYFIRYQNCCHLDDMLTRRLSLSYVLKNFSDKKSIVDKIASIMAREMQWTEKEKISEISQYL